jgi:hypothetical protein
MPRLGPGRRSQSNVCPCADVHVGAVAQPSSNAELRSTNAPCGRPATGQTPLAKQSCAALQSGGRLQIPTPAALDPRSVDVERLPPEEYSATRDWCSYPTRESADPNASGAGRIDLL